MALEFPERLTETEKAGYLIPYDNWSNRIATLRFVHDIPMTRRHPTYETLDTISEKLGNLKSKPMLIAWGMKDWCFTPAFLDGWKTRFPDARVVEYPFAGHYVFEDARAELTETVAGFILDSSTGLA
jgi:haloalkane dehalogenase